MAQDYEVVGLHTLITFTHDYSQYLFVHPTTTQSPAEANSIKFPLMCRPESPDGEAAICTKFAFKGGTQSGSRGEPATSIILPFTPVLPVINYSWAAHSMIAANIPSLISHPMRNIHGL